MPKAKRRQLRFASLDEVDAELARLEALHAQGQLRALRTYSPAQNLYHLARWMKLYQDRDLPTGLPIHLKIVGRLMRRRLLRKGFPAGLPGPEGKVQPEPEVPFEEAIDFLRRIHDAMRTEDFGQHEEFLGGLTHEQVVMLHLRHCELHLGFIGVRDAA